MHAGADPERAAEVSGAWLVLAQVAALDSSAPSWEFLQVRRTPSLCSQLLNMAGVPPCDTFERMMKPSTQPCLTRPCVALRGDPVLGRPDRACPFPSPGSLEGLHGVLQEHWQKVRAVEGWNAGAGEGGASVLRVIGHAAARFPDSEAASLCKDLLKVNSRMCLPVLPAQAQSVHLRGYVTVSLRDPITTQDVSWTSEIVRTLENMEAAHLLRSMAIV